MLIDRRDPPQHWPPYQTHESKENGNDKILRRIWLFCANKMKSSESGGKQPTQLIVELNSSLWHIIVTVYIADSSNRGEITEFDFIRWEIPKST